MPFKEIVNKFDDYIIAAGLLTPLIVWSIYAIRKRGYSLRSMHMLMLAEAIPLAILGQAFVRELIN